MARSSERTFGIHGLGGVGKTQLALKYISQHADEYTHVFWVVADTGLKLRTASREMAIDLGIIEETVSDLDKGQNATRQWLNNHTKWLLVLDNVESPASLKGYLPSPVKGTIIFTSRTAALVEHSIATDGLKLDTLSDVQGSRFLLGRVPQAIGHNCEDQATEIARELGGHPLALSTMAAYITDSQCSLSDFLRYYRRNKEAFISSSHAVSMTSSFDYDLTLATCWSLSMGSLYGRASGGLLGIVAFLDPDSITEDMFKGFAEDDTAVEISALKDPSTYLQALIELRGHAIGKELPDRPSTQPKAVITVHRLVQEAWIRALREKQTQWKALEDAVLCVSRIYPHQINGESMADDFPECRALTPHVTNLEKHYNSFYGERQNGSAPFSKRLGERLAALLADAGWFLYETGQWEGANALFKTGENICKDVFRNTPHPLTALMYNNMGVICDSQYQAEESLSYAMKAMSIREKCLGPDDPEMGNSYSNFGHGLVDLGRYEEAQKYYKAAINVHERSENPSYDLLEGAYSCMGSSMLYLQRLDEAEAWLKKAMEQHKFFKSDNFFVALTLFHLATLRMKQGRWDDAERIVCQSLEQRMRILGPNARLIGVTYHHLGFILDKKGDLEGAADALRNAVAVFRVPSQTHPGLLQRSMQKLACVLDKKGDKNSVSEAADLWHELSQLCKSETRFRSIPFRSEKAWNDVVSVAYRCV